VPEKCQVSQYKVIYAVKDDETSGGLDEVGVHGQLFFK